MGGVPIEYTVFDTPDEMVSKMQSNGSDFDLIVTVTLDNIGKLAQGGLIQPLNNSYLPNVQDNLATGIPDFYDVGRQYSAPYVIFTTGVALAERPDHRRRPEHGEPVRHLLGHDVRRVRRTC